MYICLISDISQTCEEKFLGRIRILFDSDINWSQRFLLFSLLAQGSAATTELLFKACQHKLYPPFEFFKSQSHFNETQETLTDFALKSQLNFSQSIFIFVQICLKLYGLMLSSKGWKISEGVFNLVPSSKTRTKSLNNPNVNLQGQ